MHPARCKLKLDLLHSTKARFRGPFISLGFPFYLFTGFWVSHTFSISSLMHSKCIIWKIIFLDWISVCMFVCLYYIHIFYFTCTHIYTYLCHVCVTWHICVYMCASKIYLHNFSWFQQKSWLEYINYHDVRIRRPYQLSVLNLKLIIKATIYGVSWLIIYKYCFRILQNK